MDPLLVICIFFLTTQNVNGGSSPEKNRSFYDNNNDNKNFLKKQRATKSLSIFSLVAFENIECTTQSDILKKGVCLSMEECSGTSGVPSGNCASGFGVCCTHSVSNCGGIVSQNISFIQSPMYPVPYNPGTSNCRYTINKVCADICSIRFDFCDLKTSIPTNGQCGTDNFDSVMFISSTGRNLPGPRGLCGNGFEGQHLYMDAGSSSSEAISFILGSQPVDNRMWNIKVTQVECSNLNLPPQGCTQYFTETRGSFKSYNFDGGRFNSGNLYSYCFRQEEGYCKINYSAAAPDSFSLQGFPTKSQNLENDKNCKNAGLIILTNSQPQGSSLLCGGKFNAGSKQTQNGVVQSDTTPFRLHFRTIRDFKNNGMKGFHLNYIQVPCT